MNKQKVSLVLGGGGFIGHHLAKRIKSMGDKVIVIDIKSIEEASEYAPTDTYCHHYLSLDLSKDSSWEYFEHILADNEVDMYQLAADMGGAGYVFTGDNDFSIITTSVKINTLASTYAAKYNCKVFYSSSACCYPAYNQTDPTNPKCTEDSAYPAQPDSTYGLEKLFSEQIYLAANKNLNLNVRIGRFHNIMGPEGTYKGGKEKAPAAICRKVAEAKDESFIDIWGPGTQTRSFLHITDCIDAVLTLMSQNEFIGPVNIGSEEMVSINQLAKMVIDISGKNITINNIEGPIGVMGRNSDNTLIKARLGWEPKINLKTGLITVYDWINKRINSN